MFMRSLVVLSGYAGSLSRKGTGLLFVGDDWAEEHHDVELQDQAGRVLAKARLEDRAIGKVVSGWLPLGHAGWPRMKRARVGLREIHRRLDAMLVRPAVRRAPMARLRRPARI